jgi:hypothetical protein
MARRRNNVIPLQPPKLLTFKPEDWLPATGDRAWQMWSDARFAYLLEHKGQKLGDMDVVSVIYEEPPWSA